MKKKVVTIVIIAIVGLCGYWGYARYSEDNLEEPCDVPCDVKDSITLADTALSIVADSALVPKDTTRK